MKLRRRLAALLNPVSSSIQTASRTAIEPWLERFWHNGGPIVQDWPFFSDPLFANPLCFQGFSSLAQSKLIILQVANTINERIKNYEIDQSINMANLGAAFGLAQ